MMNVLITMNQPEVKLDGVVLERHAIKGIVSDGGKVLMLLSGMNGDYKFPGGGQKQGESDIDTLIREFKEECGVDGVSIVSEFGAVVENNKARDEGVDIFRITNCYYICKASSSFGEQNLDQYEADIKLKPVWVPVKEAIQANETVLGSDNCPAWVARETEVLKLLETSMGSLGSYEVIY